MQNKMESYCQAALKRLTFSVKGSSLLIHWYHFPVQFSSNSVCRWIKSMALPKMKCPIQRKIKILQYCACICSKIIFVCIYLGIYVAASICCPFSPTCPLPKQSHGIERGHDLCSGHPLLAGNLQWKGGLPWTTHYLSSFLLSTLVSVWRRRTNCL